MGNPKSLPFTDNVACHFLSFMLLCSSHLSALDMVTRSELTGVAMEVARVHTQQVDVSQVLFVGVVVRAIGMFSAR